MALPTVAIIGRPNVGKSSLLNSLAGEMISIVEPTAGVTRDRVSAVVNSYDSYFELIDTGGYGIEDIDNLTGHVENQIRQAIIAANLVIFMVDIRDGLTPLDQKVARLLRKTQLDVVLVANKADNAKMFPAAAEFERLGFGRAICISAKHYLNRAVLLEEILEKLKHLPAEKPKEPEMKIAVVGKRNAGKSTIVNSIVGDKRVIVSETPGTTRDSVDVRFSRNGKEFVIIDTAGVRKKSKMADSIEFYSFARAQRSITRSDVVIFMIDATLSISQVDKKLAKMITDEYKSCIIVINKWDLAQDSAESEDYGEYLTKMLPGLKYAPIAFTTATEGRGVSDLLDLSAELFGQANTNLSTGQLNKAVQMIQSQQISAAKAKSGFPKIYYATQISANPITLLFFVNRPESFEENYQRFLINQFRTLLPIDEVPIRLLIRPRRDRKE